MRGEEPRSSTALSRLKRSIVLALERFDFFRCAILAAPHAAINMVVQFEANGLEGRFWIAPVADNFGLMSLV